MSDIAQRMVSFLADRRPALFRLVGSPSIVRVSPASETTGVVAVLRYNIPLDLCHSYDASLAIGTKEGDANLPVVQGGLLNGVLDNAMTIGMQVASGGRFVTTLDMQSLFVRPTRPGVVWVEISVPQPVANTVGFATARLCSDSPCRRVTALATSTNKLSKPNRGLRRHGAPAKARL
jgi:acyl-coenzyme A thioesterase PaaI-like protein